MVRAVYTVLQAVLLGLKHDFARQHLQTERRLLQVEGKLDQVRARSGSLRYCARLNHWRSSSHAP